MKKSTLLVVAMVFAASASAQIGTALVNQAKEAINAKTGKTQVKVDSAVSKTGKVTDPFLPGAAANVKANVKAAIDKKAQAVADFIDGKQTDSTTTKTTQVAAASATKQSTTTATKAKTKTTTKAKTTAKSKKAKK